MKAIKHINSEDIIAIDIETVRIKEHFSELSEEFQSAWEYKHKQDGKVPTFEELESLWIEKSSLYPEFSKVCSVALVYLKKEKLTCKQYTSPHEFLILEELARDLGKIKKSRPAMRLVGHSSKFFDYPFLCKRYLINRMDIPDILDESSAKPWDQTLLCTNELWKSFGAFNNAGSSLQALCVAFDVPVSKVDLVGDEVGKAFFAGELERIGTYCSLDTIATFNIFRRFKLESIFLPIDVDFVNKDELLSLAKAVEDIPLLQSIFESGKISSKDWSKLQKSLTIFTAEERENIVLIIRACLKDNPTATEKKYLEIIEGK